MPVLYMERLGVSADFHCVGDVQDKLSDETLDCVEMVSKGNIQCPMLDSRITLSPGEEFKTGGELGAAVTGHCTGHLIGPTLLSKIRGWAEGFSGEACPHR